MDNDGYVRGERVCVTPKTGKRWFGEVEEIGISLPAFGPERLLLAIRDESTGTVQLVELDTTVTVSPADAG